MDFNMLAKIGAILASLFCFAAGAAMIFPFIKSQKWDDLTFLGFGLYFIGKGFFVGPMLISTLNAQRTKSKSE